jgi:hypothetical protein
MFGPLLIEYIKIYHIFYYFLWYDKTLGYIANFFGQFTHVRFIFAMSRNELHILDHNELDVIVNCLMNLPCVEFLLWIIFCLIKENMHNQR